MSKYDINCINLTNHKDKKLGEVELPEGVEFKGHDHYGFLCEDCKKPFDIVAKEMQDSKEEHTIKDVFKKVKDNS